MKQILFSFPEDTSLATKLSHTLALPLGQATFRHFPDGESYVRIEESIQEKEILLLCNLKQPDTKAMMLKFFCHVAREMGSSRIGLIAPYLGYMRQDKRFQAGEAITSSIFAKFLSGTVDWLLTIDPHLHRHHSLKEIYSIPAKTLHASSLIATWILNHIKDPLLIGPDEESQQWVSEVAQEARAPYAILSKIRHGDNKVEVHLPDLGPFKKRNPILLDDIISTGHTLSETLKRLKEMGFSSPVCLGVHALFSEGAQDLLIRSGAGQVVTCNTIPHPTNAIDVSHLLAKNL